MAFVTNLSSTNNMNQFFAAQNTSISVQPQLVNSPFSGAPKMVDSLDSIAMALDSLSNTAGPIALDTERASSYRYNDCAYLVQIKRGNGPIFILDPIALAGKLSAIAQIIDGPEWVLHDASQDLPYLNMLGMRPAGVYDTEIAAQIIGESNFGLGAVVENTLGYALAKEHSRANWSTRPIPASWLNYAALDVEFLLEIRNLQIEELQKTGRLEWAIQEFEYVRLAPPKKKHPEPWRKIKHFSDLRTGIGRQIARNIFEAREGLAKDLDLSPSMIIHSEALISAGIACPKSRRQLLNLPEFRNNQVRRNSNIWWRAVDKAIQTPVEKYPSRNAPRLPGDIPDSKNWAQNNLEAAQRLSMIRLAVLVTSQESKIPPQRLLIGKVQKKIAWELRTPYKVEFIKQQMLALGARPWQADILSPVIYATLTNDDSTAKS